MTYLQAPGPLNDLCLMPTARTPDAALLPRALRTEGASNVMVDKPVHACPVSTQIHLSQLGLDASGPVSPAARRVEVVMEDGKTLFRLSSQKCKANP